MLQLQAPKEVLANLKPVQLGASSGLAVGQKVGKRDCGPCGASVTLPAHGPAVRLPSLASARWQEAARYQGKHGCAPLLGRLRWCARWSGSLDQEEARRLLSMCTCRPRFPRSLPSATRLAWTIP